MGKKHNEILKPYLWDDDDALVNDFHELEEAIDAESGEIIGDHKNSRFRLDILPNSHFSILQFLPDILTLQTLLHILLGHVIVLHLLDDVSDPVPVDNLSIAVHDAPQSSTQIHQTREDTEKYILK